MSKKINISLIFGNFAVKGTKWLTNTTQPNLETMMQIARVLKVQVDDLLRLDELPKNETNVE